MSIIKIAEDKCISCGLCEKACPSKIIYMENGIPKCDKETCMACGHCVAICPTKAFDHKLSPLNETIEFSNIVSKKEAKELLLTRRSIRNFKEESIKKELLEELLDVGRQAPTGTNSQGLSYLVIENKEILARITETCVDYLEILIEKGVIKDSRYKAIIKSYRETGRDIALLGAPCVVIPIAKAPFAESKRTSASISMTYAQIYAPTLGLGTCWAGFVELVLLAGYKPMIDAINMPEGYIPVGAMMVGYPKYKYNRIPKRNDLNIIWE